MSDSSYDDVKRRFEAAAESTSMPYRDDAFIADAVIVFCMEHFRQQQSDSAYGRAAHAIAERLMALPDMEKEWRVSFPYAFMPKGNLTKSQKQSRSIAFEVVSLIEAGAKVTHAIAQVAVKRNFSPQKVTADYYEWQPKLRPPSKSETQ